MAASEPIVLIVYWASCENGTILFTSSNANKNSKVKSSPYFTKDEGEKYYDAIEEAESNAER